MIVKKFLLALLAMIPTSLFPEAKLSLALRSRTGPDADQAVAKKVEWKASQTALIICDMWDDHWCKSAARRVVELAGPMNEVVRQARSMGILIIHAPSSVVDF